MVGEKLIDQSAVQLFRWDDVQGEFPPLYTSDHCFLLY